MENFSNMKCQSCGCVSDFLEEHHIIPKSQGGSNKRKNILLICNDCHYKIHHPDCTDDTDINQFNEEYKEAIEENIFSEGWGIIPNKILRDSTISAGAKILYAEISSLCASKGYCWASNKYFAKQLNVSQTTISNWITQLEKYLKFTERSSSRRKIFVHTLNKKASKDLTENCKVKSEPYRKLYGNLTENCKHNNNSNNNNKKKVFIPPSLLEIQQYNNDRKLGLDCEKFFEYFSAGDWHDSLGNPVKNWKQKMITWSNHLDKKTNIKKQMTTEELYGGQQNTCR